MATIASFNVALTVSAAQFISNLSRAERQWNSFARSVQRQSKTLPAAIKDALPASLALGRNVAKFTAAAGAALTALGAVGIKLAADFEQTRIGFENLLGSADRAREFLGDLTQFAAQTPFQFRGLADASQQLLTYGFRAEEVLPTLNALGNAVAAMGKGQAEIERAVLALGQMRARTRVSGEEMRQLTELGIPAWEMLAKTIGVSIPEAMALVEKRAIDAQTGIAAILQGIATDPRFAGAMERQSKTMLGRLSTLRDNAEIILRGMGEDLIRVLRLPAAIDKLTNALAKFASIVQRKGFIGALKEAFPPWLAGTIVAIAGAITGALVPAITAALIPAVKKLTVSLWAMLAPLWPYMLVGAAVAMMIATLAGYWHGLGNLGTRTSAILAATLMWLGSIVARVTSAIIAALSWIIPGLRGAAEEVRLWADAMADAARSALNSARTINEISRGAEDIAETGKDATNVQLGLGDALEQLNEKAQKNLQTFDEVHQIEDELTDVSLPTITIPELPGLPNLNITGSIGEGISKLGDSLVDLSVKADQAMNTVGNAWEQIREKLSEIPEKIKKTVEVTIELVLTLLLGKKIIDWFNDWWNSNGPKGPIDATGVATVTAEVGLLAKIKASISVEKWLEAIKDWWRENAPDVIATTLAVTAGFLFAPKITGLLITWLDAVIAWIYVHGIPAVALAGLAVTATLGLLPKVVELALGWADAVGRWLKEHPVGEVATGLAITATFLLAPKVIGLLLPWLQAVMAWVYANGIPMVALAGLAVTATLGLIPKIASLVRGWLEAIQEWWKEHAPGEIETGLAVTALFGLLPKIAGWAASLVAKVQEWWNQNKPAEIDLTASPVLVWVALSFAFWAGLAAKAQEWWNETKATVESALAVAVAAGVSAGEVVVEFGFKLFNELAQKAQEFWNDIKQKVVDALADALADGIHVGEVLVSLALKLWDGLEKAIEDWWKPVALVAVIGAIGAAIVAAGVTVAGAPAALAATAAVALAFALWSGLAQASDTFAVTYKGAVQQDLQRALDKSGPIQTLADVKIHFQAETEWAKLWDSITQKTQIAVNRIDALQDWLRMGVTQKWRFLEGDMKSIVAAMAADIEKSFKLNGAKVTSQQAQTIAQLVYQWMQAQDILVGHSIIPDMLSDILAAFRTMGASIVGEVQSHTSDVTSAWESTALSIKSTVENTVADIATALLTGKGDWRSILSGAITEILNMIIVAAIEAAGVAKWIQTIISNLWNPLGWFAIAGAIAGLLAIQRGLQSKLSATKMAQGGIVTGPTLAMMGEGGRKEAVVPLERDNVIADSVGQAVYEAVLTAMRVNQASGQAGGGDREIVLRIDGATFARAVLPAMIRESQRQGVQLVLRPQGV